MSFHSGAPADVSPLHVTVEALQLGNRIAAMLCAMNRNEFFRQEKELSMLSMFFLVASAAKQ